MPTHAPWDASIQCDGGPVLVADFDTFERWLGAAPFVQMRATLPADHPEVERLPEQKTIRFWGHFTAELPEPFRFIGGGHRSIECASQDDARRKLLELRGSVRAAFDGVLVDDVDTDGTFRFQRHDGLVLFAQLAPNSYYDAVWQSHETAVEGYVHTIAGGPALFWQMEGVGVADVLVAADRSQIVLARTWLSGDEQTEAEETAAVQALASQPTEDEELLGEIAIESGIATILWAPIGYHQVTEYFEEPDVRARVAKENVVSLSTGMLPDIGSALRVSPGRWRASAGRHENEQFHCHWCRLRRV
jgi:hypothetical protein